jgi:hypothetical protein
LSFLGDQPFLYSVNKIENNKLLLSYQNTSEKAIYYLKKYIEIN